MSDGTTLASESFRAGTPGIDEREMWSGPQPKPPSQGSQGPFGRQFERTRRQSKMTRLSTTHVSIKGLTEWTKKPRAPTPSTRPSTATPFAGDGDSDEDEDNMTYQGIPAVSTAVRGVADVEECRSWMKPRQLDGGFLCSLARLSVEVDVQSREWHNQRGPHTVSEEIPLDPFHTAEAASLLLRVVRSLPGRLPLRTMLEPLTQVLLRAVYRDWVFVPSLADCEEATLALDSIMKWIPFYALAKGLQGVTESSKGEAIAATAEAESLRATTKAAVQELAVQSEEARKFEAMFELEAVARKKAERKVEDVQDAYRKLQSDMRSHLAELTEIQNSHYEVRQELRASLFENKMKDGKIEDLSNQVERHTSTNSWLQEENAKTTTQLLSQKAAIELLPSLKEKIESYESTENVQGVAFAVRVSKDVLGLALVDICGVSEATLTKRRSQVGFQNTGQMKVVLDTVCSRLKKLPMEIVNLKAEIASLHQEVKDYRQLIPIWNQDAMEELEDLYDQDAPVHRQIFSMKDRRSFAGLGMGDDVPPYLRAEGFVRHLFVSKIEVQDFMREFKDDFFAPNVEHRMSTECMHNELYSHMKLRFSDKKDENHDALTEFAYAFICSLEAYRDDPDFELFDLILSGAVHPTIMKDQREMLHNIEALTRSCQEAAGTTEETRSSRKGAGNDKKEQVSRRVVRAVLEVVFPEKTPVRGDALRRALYLTVQALQDGGKALNHECVYLKDLFEAAPDGSQSPLAEEIMRQHMYEVIEWTCELSRQLINGRNLWDRSATVTEHRVVEVVASLDVHCTHQHAQELARIGCPEPFKNEHVHDVMQRLRHGALLRPKRLWIRSEAKEVVKHLLATAHANTDINEVVSSNPMHTRRSRAVKVLDNPIKLMKSDEYNDPDSLEKVISRTQRPEDATQLPASGEPTPG